MSAATGWREAHNSHKSRISIILIKIEFEDNKEWKSMLKVPELKNFTPVPSHDAQFACMLVLEAAAGGINAGQTGRRSQGFQPLVAAMLI